MEWFLENRPEMASQISFVKHTENGKESGRWLAAIPTRDRLIRVLRRVLDESEFLSPFGVRSMSKVHASFPFIFQANGEEHRVEYVPGESTTGLFGGNSNWRGPIWFPVNYLLIESLERYHYFYGDSLQVECPVGSGKMLNLADVACELSRRLTTLFVPDETGGRPCHGQRTQFSEDPHWRDYILFHEYFHGENGRGLGAGHQTGWTALVANLMRDTVKRYRTPHVDNQDQ